MGRQILCALLLLPFATSSVVRFMPEGRAIKRDFGVQSAEKKAENGNFVSELAPSGICGGLACPPSQLVQDAGTYQLRYFSAAPYAKSRLEGVGFEQAFQVLYTRLHDYFNGQNTKNLSMPMTNPVILRMDTGSEELWSTHNHTLFFFISPEVASPPEPTDQTVKLIEVNDYYMYIRTFPGNPVTYAEWMAELLQLASDLDADGVTYVKSYFYFAFYSNPADVTDRINEVQLLRPRSSSLE